ncbi:Nitrate/sulfonate/bicarbonate ABC transporter periplasmic ligand-binding protein [Frankia canadensis]|uniref:Nitrate/sulfonate/bicarbonate ABC transporter periplasmic ligand-binding protein n=1 Tax=Frankia canadensis TaxID=1836972 RepID=A0A2I2KW04_9ACTN|nr:ABC transporter substrate-binding protein [Frankia canadensis]SNQ49835.1 Nitrate/sulfonate/bicarbonate ABC transporter periplasmic ligand-binding protein [Frankia canadensis]SOU57125.1 Nitrate/sulfonate/bicarbonate ABC transporter periplasmic ligand-binding protein [Frankia canadensis]
MQGSIRMLTRRRRGAVAAVVALVLTLAACSSSGGSHSSGSGGSATAAPDLSKVTLKLGQITASEAAQIKLSGVFDDTPYKVSWSTFAGPAPMMTALLAGAIDAGANFGDVSVTLANANSSTPWTADNAPAKTIGVLATTHPLYQTIATTSSGITSLDDLRGKRFAYNNGGNIQAQYLLDLKKAGLTPADVKPIVIQAATQGSTFAAGATDVLSTSAGVAVPFLAEGKARVIATQNDIGLPGLNAFVASTKALKDPAKRAAFADVLTRLTKFYAWYAKNLPAVAKQSESVSNVPAKYSLEEAKYAGSYLVPTTPDIIAKEQALADLLVEGGVIKSKVDVSAQYDQSFNSVISAGNAVNGIPRATS